MTNSQEIDDGFMALPLNLNAQPLISIVVVGFRAIDDNFRTTFKAFLNQTYPNFEIIVIWSDFSSDYNIKAQLMTMKGSNSHKVSFYAYRENLGFARGYNIGSRKAKGQLLFIVNPDVYIKSNFLHELINRYQYLAQRKPLSSSTKIESDSTTTSTPTPVILMPRISNPTGIVEYSRRTINFLGVSNMDFSKSNKIRRTMVLSGCAIILRKMDYWKLKGFDTRYFMYREDIDFSIRAHTYGMKMYVDNSIKLWHLKKDAEYRMTEFKYYYVERNRLIFCFEHATSKKGMLVAQLLLEPLQILFALSNFKFLRLRAQIYKDIIFNWQFLAHSHEKENNFFDTKYEFGGLDNEIKYPFLETLLNWYAKQIFRIYNTFKRR